MQARAGDVMGRNRGLVSVLASIAVVLLTCAALAPSLGGDSAWIAVVAPILIGGALIALAARLAALFAHAASPTPQPIRIRAPGDDRIAPQHVDLRGRPEHPRAPGCGLR